MRVLGVDLAWAEGSEAKKANETGLVALDLSGRIVDAGWSCGLDETTAWIERWSEPDTFAAIDAPLVVENPTGQRLCETQVGQRYGRWKVSANSTNLTSAHLAGVALRQRIERLGWQYHDGRNGPPTAGRFASEVYPYTTIVGAPELGYDVERPTYKRKPKQMKAGTFKPIRAAAFDGLVHAIDSLRSVVPPLDLRSHPVTAKLATEPTPLDNRAYKHREDLLDAVLCAWTGVLWVTAGFQRCQVLGLTAKGERDATIIAPARPTQVLI